MSVRWAPSASASALPLALPGAAGAAGSGRGARGSARGPRGVGRDGAVPRGAAWCWGRCGAAGPGRAVLFCSLLFLAVLSCAGRGREAAAAVVAPPWRCAAAFPVCV